ncbi:hypothetical protein [Rhizosphaericola mali]|uniref:Capsule assembly Wzi family protein n=1 Tax=Rhizosphaericola mali TaxID=2545455 RepID=A0A5P2FYI7_9BACT|nr:hypothetical protein [Rhizosphaericola mali]QES87997.1 hypothetical protein E0W69_004725 [Rhizosphaericola mali]
MQIRKVLPFLLFAFCFHKKVHAQSDFIPLGDPQEAFIKRMEIKFRNEPQLQFSTVRPYSRQRITEAYLRIDSLDRTGSIDGLLTDVDRADLQQYLTVNATWSPENKYQVNQSNKTFFKTPAHLFESYSDKFGIVVDPMLTFQYGKNKSMSTYQNSLGLSMHGNIGSHFGFFGSYTGNIEKDPGYVQDFIQAYQAVPGIGYYNNGKNGRINYNYWTGGITTNVGKHIDFELAYDKFFIGDGYRSLYLSDFSAPYLFLKMHFQTGRFEYTTAIARTYAPYGIVANGLDDQNRPSNYMVFHYFNFQPWRWLKLGFFENNMFNNEKNGGIQLGMLNPFIFNRAMSQNVGNSGKSSIGLDLKANVTSNVQLYGTILINEFVAKEVFNYGSGDWRNKHGIQFGAKYTDAFNVKNLDLLGEYNWVRPFTYTDKWNVNNYVHYNMPLADPLGANFHELIGVANYHPIPKLFFTAKIIGYKKGLDTTAEFGTSTQPLNGGDLLRPYTDAHAANGYVKVGDGIPLNGLFGSFQASYEILPNLFFDGNITFRKADIQGMPKNHTNYFSFGIRWNMARRNFEF